MITARKFGALPNGDSVTAYDFKSTNGFKATVLSYGATLQSLIFPDGTDVILGFDELEAYLGEHPYFGAIIGRVANRIGRACFEIDGKNYELPTNEGANNLHGGPEGFDRINWEGEIKDDILVLQHVSPDGHQGFPGMVKTELQFQFDGNTLSLEMKATTDKATPINLTYHPYFNLTDGGITPCTDHRLEIKAGYYMPKYAQNLPTGEIQSCIESTYDYKEARTVDAALDHNFVQTQNVETGMFKLAKLGSETTGHKVIICSTQPCLQAYAGGFIPEISGKSGITYGPHHGVALEPQGYPDSFSHDNFPDNILRPGETYHHKINYTFRPGAAPA